MIDEDRARGPTVPIPDRLTRMIARLTTQRACLDFAAAEVAKLPGCVVEVGLGKGRTYDRLRSLMPERAIFALDRLVHCPDDVRPLPSHLMVGDFRDSLASLVEQIGRSAALVHADIGSDDYPADVALAESLSPQIARIAQPRALVLCDRPMSPNPLDRWRPVPLPAGAAEWTYFIYRVG